MKNAPQLVNKKYTQACDCCVMDDYVHPNLMVERLGVYLSKHGAHVSRPHRHSFYQVVWFNKGGGSHWIDFQKFPVKPYQVYFMAPGQVHSWNLEDETDGYIVHFKPDLFDSFLQVPGYIEQFLFFKGHVESCVHHVPTNLHNTVAGLFHTMLVEIHAPEGSLDLIRIRLLELFIRVQRCCTPLDTGRHSQQSILLVNHFMQLIGKHYRQLKLPKEYAALLAITPNHLNALCQEVTGRTAGDIIRERVLLEARRLLAVSDMDVNEIAFNLNFKDNSYFSRFFKKYACVTPEKFRKEVNRKLTEN